MASSFTPFGRSGCVTHAAADDLDTQLFDRGRQYRLKIHSMDEIMYGGVKMKSIGIETKQV